MICARDGKPIKKGDVFIKTMVGDKEIFFHEGCFDEKAQVSIPVKQKKSK